MNHLIDIGHPAHVHLYRNLYNFLNKKHKVYVTVKSNLESAKKLLTLYKIPYISIGSKSDNLIFKAFKQLSYDLQISFIVHKKNIDIGIGSSINLAHASRVTKMHSIIMDDDDDEVQPLFTKFAHPFCNVLLSPESLRNKRKKKNTIYYPGFHELAYLHPKYFSPDPKVLIDAALKENDTFFVLRFNSFKAHHDIGKRGISLENQRKLVDLFKPYGKIFITTETAIHPEFQEFQITIAPHKIHSLLFYARMFVGDSQTMTNEAAILGTPAYKCNSFAGKLSVPDELEYKYGLCYSYFPENFDGLMSQLEKDLKNLTLKSEWKEKRAILLAEKIDVTEFLVNFIQDYPAIIKRLPKYPVKLYEDYFYRGGATSIY